MGGNIRARRGYGREYKEIYIMLWEDKKGLWEGIWDKKGLWEGI